MTVGVVGAGQLGAMLALAGYPLGIEFLFLDRTQDTPAGRFAPVLTGDFADRQLLRQLAERSEVISFDWENISVEALRAATRATRARIAPPLRALAAAQDRLIEKRSFERLGIATTRFAAVDSLRSLERAMRRIGVPGVLKTRRLGYDGKGQFVVHCVADAASAHAALGGVPLLYEEFVPFDYEVSVIGARSRHGEMVVYPLNRNFHDGGILRLTLAPWSAPRLLRAGASSLRRVLEDFRYVGVLTIEFFVTQGRLIANEMAPRVHNSGHWTIEGAVTSQFENHVRAITGMPLGDTAASGHAAMINFIGKMPDTAEMLRQPGLHFHHYGKQPRPGRKLGHCTIVESTAARRNLRAKRLLQRVYPQLHIKP
ncbi:MAG TPA: 5-(carboxyamino)imidazole ribonucleotide synthase [Steroidobacteraceae bacterium]|jgi:5-(carboxyamino)imidazole ribonucleotide synthase